MAIPGVYKDIAEANTYITKKQGLQSLGLYKDCGYEKGIYRVKNRTNF